MSLKRANALRRSERTATTLSAISEDQSQDGGDSDGLSRPKVLVLWVHSASDLMPKDIGVSSDPFVTISLDDRQVAQTVTIPSNLNPKWRERFVIPLTTELHAKQLKIEVWNEYKFGKMTGRVKNIGKHAFLGQVTIPMDEITFRYMDPANGLGDGPVSRAQSMQRSAVDLAAMNVEGDDAEGGEEDLSGNGEPQRTTSVESDTSASSARSVFLHSNSQSTDATGMAPSEVDLSESPADEGSEGQHTLSLTYRDYELQKRSKKSNVRGSIKLCALLTHEDCVREHGHKCSIVRNTERRKSHYSMSELRDFSTFHEGTTDGNDYRLFVELVKIRDPPRVEKSRKKPLDVCFKISSQHKKSVSKTFRIAQNNDVNEEIDLESECLSTPVKSSQRVVSLQMLYSNLVGVNTSLGSLKLHMENIPVIESAQDEEVPMVMAYIDRFAGQRLPSNVKVSTSRSVCRLRFRAWLEVETPDDDDSVDEDDDDALGNGSDATSATSGGVGSIAQSPVFSSYSEPSEEAVLSKDKPAVMPTPLDWPSAQKTVNMDVHRVNWLLFSADSPLTAKIVKARNLSEASYPAWTEGTTAESTRTVSYVMPKSKLVKANRATEKQQYVVACKDAYAVTISTETPEVPMGKDFFTNVLIVLERQSGTKTKVTVTGGITFTKSNWMKGVITNGAKGGIKDTYTTVLSELDKMVKKVLRSVSQSGDASSAFDANGGDGMADGEADDDNEDEDAADGNGAKSGISSVLEKLPGLLKNKGIIVAGILGLVVIVLVAMLIQLQSNIGTLTERIAHLEGALKD